MRISDWSSDVCSSDLVQPRQVEHRIKQNRFHDRAQAAGAGLAGDRLEGDGLEGILGELEAHVLHLEEALVLINQGVLRLRQDLTEGALSPILQIGQALGRWIESQAGRDMECAGSLKKK